MSAALSSCSAKDGRGIWPKVVAERFGDTISGKVMKHLLSVGLVFVGGLSTSICADAADMSVPAFTPVLAYNWSGVYVGGHGGFGEAGYSGVLDTSSTTNPFEDPGLLDLSGGLGGFHAGFNAQHGNIVWGVEGDITFVDFSDSSAAAVPDTGAPGPTTDTISGSVDHLASIRGRAGVAHYQTLFYGTAGIAFADADFSMLDDETLVTGSLDMDATGFVFGGGVEGALHGGPWLVRAETLYYDFDETNSGAALTPDNDPADVVTFDDVWTIRFGVSYLLGH
jgi:outer membrane immunogenic protein